MAKPFKKGGVDVSPLAYGQEREGLEWLPYRYSVVRPPIGGYSAKVLGAAMLHHPRGRTAIIAGERVIDSATRENCVTPNILAAASVLRRLGMHFAELHMDSKGAILSVDPFPNLVARSLVCVVANSLSKVICDSINCGRA